MYFFRQIRTARKLAFILAAVWLASPLASARVGGAQKYNFADFIRVISDSERGAMQTANLVFANPDSNQRVTLISAVHVASDAYYQRLNELFADFDVVLYELVADETTISQLAQGKMPSGENSSVIGFLQKSLTNLLALSFQLDKINYSAPNFVHCDLHADEFASAQNQRGENFLSLYMQSLEKAQQSGNLTTNNNQTFTPAALLRMLFSPERSNILRQNFALAMVQNLHLLPDESVILQHRNQVIFDGIRAQLAAGKKNIAVFYGAAHLPEVANFLSSKLIFGEKSRNWHSAWYF